jgi:hypothetical protein
VTAQTDKYLMSWYYWQFKYNMDSTCSTNPPWLHAFYYPNGTLQQEKVQTLAYSYAYAICGRVSNQAHATGSYTLSFFPADCGEKHTEVFLNLEWDFPSGFVLKFSPECPKCRLSMVSPGYYEVIVDKELHGRVVTLQVGAKMRSEEGEQ